jgi:type I restriction enzyme S subunit
MSSKTTSIADKSGGGKVLTPERRFPEFQEAGAWETVALGSAASISTKKVGDNTCIPMSITSGVGLVSQIEKFGRIIAGDSYKNYLLLQRNDFAYNKSATKEYPEGFIALYTGEELAAVPNSIFTCFRIKSASLSSKYLNYLLLGNLHGRWLRKFIEVGARAHGSLSINDRDLLAMPVPIPGGPLSLQEQQKIANCLASADALIEAQGRKVEAIKAHKKGLMQQLFPQEGETQPRVRFPEFEGAGEWMEKSLGEIIEVASGQVDPTQTPYRSFPQIGSENIESISGKLVNVKSASEKGVMSGNYVFDKNDILYSKIRPALNKVAAPDFKGICSADIYPVRPSTGGLLRSFLLYLLRSDNFLGYAIRNSERGKIPKINRDGLLSYRTLLPAPPEQKRIADCLTSLEDLVVAEVQKFEALKTHKKGLMQQLFPQVGEE